MLLLFIQVLLPTLRYSVRIQSRSQLQASCALAMQQMRDDLQKTNAAGLGYVNFTSAAPTTVLAFQPLNPELLGDTPAYLVELVSYSWFKPDAQLVRRHWLPAPSMSGLTFAADTAVRLSPTQLSTLPGLTPQPRDTKVACPNVFSFVISSAVNAPDVGNPLHLRLVVQRQVAAGEPDSYALEQSIFLRNSQ